MRAVVRAEYGSPDVIRLIDRGRPQPGPRQVLVRVEAAGVDIGVWHLLTGLPLMARMALGLRAPREPGLGTELAGVIEAVGSQVTRFAPGDRVYGAGTGAFAEFALAAEKNLAPLPDGVSAQNAAAAAVSGVTAYQALTRAGRLTSGESVLVLGASGGVGSFAVQIARAHGGRVTGVASTAKLDFVRSLGVDDVLDYSTTDVTDGSRRYDLILVMGGSRPLRILRQALTPRGRAVIVGGEDGGRLTGGFERSIFAGLASLPYRQKAVGLVSLTKPDDLGAVAGLLAAGSVVSSIEQVLPLAQAADALRRLEARQVRGKLVIDPAG